MSITKQKRTGSHFTPPELASFLAERLAGHMPASRGALRILDPACGDGNLLVAIAQALPRKTLARCTLIGIEKDAGAFAGLRVRLADLRDCTTDLRSGDFLDFFGDRPLFGASASIAPVDLIVANPPYVRTQVLGAARAQELATAFGLSGRIDLYQAFLVAMARQLKPGGLLGVITSNRFLSIKGGAATRGLLRSHFDLLEVIDLGDTKLFEAAVLPAIVFATKRTEPRPVSQQTTTAFLRVYQEIGDESPVVKADSVLNPLRQRRTGCYAVHGRKYRVSAGGLVVPADPAVPWTMQTTAEESWVGQVDARAFCRVGDVAQIRVGIKTTADKVFIRRDWETLPPHRRPDDRFLRPILSQDEAAKWTRVNGGKTLKRVLYTHEVVHGKRRAITFDKDSFTWRYLHSHRSRLESRKYVMEAGRQWFEIWVPQDPQAWTLPKIVFPDISPEAKFFLDRDGYIVDGNCYWITTNDRADDDLLLLILGVANSSVLARYHELCFQNRLYAQRRRYLTQYVQRYPLPSRELAESQEIVRLARRLADSDASPSRRKELEDQIDGLVARAFGVDVDHRGA